jgi:hypothetical protein
MTASLEERVDNATHPNCLFGKKLSPREGRVETVSESLTADRKSVDGGTRTAASRTNCPRVLEHHHGERHGENICGDRSMTSEEKN